jgi:hypothetical protein
MEVFVSVVCIPVGIVDAHHRGDVESFDQIFSKPARDAFALLGCEFIRKGDDEFAPEHAVGAIF